MENEINIMEKEPLPLESLQPLLEQNTGRELEKGRYWNTLLTGNLEQVPLVLRQKAGADNEKEPAEVRDYRLASNINRSWVVDHRKLSREQVRSNWPELRRGLAEEMGVKDDEQELYAALSLQQQESPSREKVRRVYADAYSATLKGEEFTQPESAEERRVYEDARAAAAQTREDYMPLAEAISQGWSYLKACETKLFPLPDMVAGAPGLVQAVDALAEMAPEERAKVYEIARSLESTRQLEEDATNLGDAMLHSIRRGTADIRHSLLQGVGHAATAMTHAAGETLNSDALLRGAKEMDKRLQSLDELRRVAQGEVFPIKLEEDSAFWEELAVDAAGAVPGAALAFMGGAGFGALTLAGAGAAVAEARHRSPEGRQEMQTAAGIVGGALQAGIYMGMSRIGAQMLNRSISQFLKARNAGVRGYSLASLKALGVLTAENAKLLLAGKAAHAAELGMQELAARVDQVASNIDWESYGDSILDIETNMREAAMNLPFILIAAGRAALHHFRSPDVVLDNRKLLEEWGVGEATHQRILDAPDIHTRTAMLREALTNSKRWGGPGFLEECMRALRLLNTPEHAPFNDEQTVRSFLCLPSDLSAIKKVDVVDRDLYNPETVRQIAERMGEKNASLLNRKQSMDYIRLWDSWMQLGQGDTPMPPEIQKERIACYLNMHSNPIGILPPEFRLDGYYNPHQAEGVKILLSGVKSEMEKLSYQFLANNETLGSLTYSYKSPEQARQHNEKKRCTLMSKGCEAIVRVMKGEDSEMVMDELCEWYGSRYENRRRTSSHAPLWFRKVERADFAQMFEKAKVQAPRFNKKKPAQLRDAYRILLGFRACVESITQLLPHTQDFQELLSMGYSPEQATSHLLAREFKDQLEPGIWSPPLLNLKDANAIDNQRRFKENQELCNRYMQLSGYGLESSPDGTGKQLWRIKRPDGHYTPWLPSYGLAVNSLVGNVKTKFLQMGRGQLMQNIERAYRYASNGSRAFYMGYMYPLAPGKFTGFDHLGRVAADELRALWQGDSTMYTMGLEFEENHAKWKRFKGTQRLPLLKDIKDGNDAFLAFPRRVETPLSLAKLRFYVYWNRMLSSGWVSPESVGEALVEAGELARDNLDSLLEKGRDKPLYIWNADRKGRRELLRKYPDRIKPGDTASMNAALARRMADYNLLFMLADLPNAKLPNSVREWCYSSALGDFKVPEIGPRLRGAVRKYNRASAEKVKDMIPRVMEIRELQRSKNGARLADMMRDAYQPNEARRYEQGWCFAVGGASAFRSCGQTFWNLLDDPARGWKLLTPEERELLTEEIRDYCGVQSPEQKLQELSEVLREYPGLRAYSSDRRNGGTVKRMELNPVADRDIVERAYTQAQNTLMMVPPVVKKGFTVEENAELPPEWRADSRVLPALQLLTELRRNVTASPYTDEAGIWWQQERYGGLDGKRPNGLDERWKPETGLQSFMNFYKRVDALGRTYGAHGQLNVCGVPLGGIREGEVDDSLLKHVTVYRSPRLPDHQVRLMPGEPNAANPYQRKPYVVHTADGVPLLPTRIARQATERLQTMSPLNTFYSDLERMYDFQTNHRWRRRQLSAYLNDLLERRTSSPEAWEQGEESSINNLELFMQMFQDGRLSYYLEGKDPTQLTRGEALAAELGRLVLLAEYGVNREASVEKLVKFCDKLRGEREDKLLLQTALHRIVSPEPNRYKTEELPRPEEDRELDLSPEDAEYY